MSNLTEFLLARIAEDEADALAARILDELGEWGYGPTPADPEELLINRYSPFRVLAECDAKRRIIDRATDASGDPYGPDEDAELRDFASVYRDHPDYRQEWADAEQQHVASENGRLCLEAERIQRKMNDLILREAMYAASAIAAEERAERAEAKVARVEALHQPDKYGDCACDLPWPCATVDALRGTGREAGGGDDAETVALSADYVRRHGGEEAIASMRDWLSDAREQWKDDRESMTKDGF